MYTHWKTTVLPLQRTGETRDGFEMDLIVLVDHLMRMEDILIRRMNVGALLTVLKEICRTEDFFVGGGRKGCLKCFFFIHKTFPPPVASLKYLCSATEQSPTHS